MTAVRSGPLGPRRPLTLLSRRGAVRRGGLLEIVGGVAYPRLIGLGPAFRIQIGRSVAVCSQ
jgi:hypothetical protein